MAESRFAVHVRRDGQTIHYPTDHSHDGVEQGMSRLLRQQLEAQFGDDAEIPEEFKAFFQVVNETYIAKEEDRRLLEHSIELGNREIFQANLDMQALFQAFPDVFFSLG